MPMRNLERRGRTASDNYINFYHAHVLTASGIRLISQISFHSSKQLSFLLTRPLTFLDT